MNDFIKVEFTYNTKLIKKSHVDVLSLLFLTKDKTSKNTENKILEIMFSYQ